MSAALPVDCVEVDDAARGQTLLADGKTRLAQDGTQPRVLRG